MRSTALSESRSETVSLQLPNGEITKIEVTQTGQEDVGFDVKQFQPVADAIEGIVQMIAAPIKKARPKKAMVIKLKGFEPKYRTRVGDYRIRYEVGDARQTIQLLQCKPRRDVYQ